MSCLYFFLLIYSIFIKFNEVFGQFLLNQYKNYGLTKPELADDAYLTIVGSFASVGNGSSRVAWALLFDKFGFRKVYTVAVVLQVLMILY